jgi:hypothetical protein
MDYVRVDTIDGYIYLENKILAKACDMRTPQYRAIELLTARPMWEYQRIKRLKKLPIDKTVNVWYNKTKR